MQASAQSLEDLAKRGGIASEHVLLEGDEILEALGSRTRTVVRRFGFRNRIRRAETAFALFSDGILSFRETKRGHSGRERSVDLLYLDPRPTVSRRFAKTSLAFALISLGCAVLAGLLVRFSLVPAAAILPALGFVTAAAIAFGICLRRTQELIAFRTQHGRVNVLRLVANVGCLRACRALAREVATEIRRQRGSSKHDKLQFLRAEVREHYRLSETGVLSAEAAGAAIRKTLTHFD